LINLVSSQAQYNTFGGHACTALQASEQALDSYLDVIDQDGMTSIQASP